MQRLSTLLFFLSISFTCSAGDCLNGRYIDAVFPQVDIHKNIQYARKVQSDGQYIDLKYDVYEPHGDTLPMRPVMLLIHGGAYLKLLDQNSPDIVLMCNYFAKRGYVTVSIDYRQEPNLLSILNEEAMVKAVARALIDTKDAVDHFVTTYQNGNPYRIDTSKAIMGGVSAGAVSTMFISYLDSLQMMPQRYWQWVSDANGGINVDSVLRHKFDLIKPKMAISVSGGLCDTSWI
jgi:acetyl esterase/lipase